MLFYLLSFSVQDLTRHIISLPILDDDDLPVFNHFLYGWVANMVVVVFVDAMT